MLSLLCDGSEAAGETRPPKCREKKLAKSVLTMSHANLAYYALASSSLPKLLTISSDLIS